MSKLAHTPWHLRGHKKSCRTAKFVHEPQLLAERLAPSWTGLSVSLRKVANILALSLCLSPRAQSDPSLSVVVAFRLDRKLRGSWDLVIRAINKVTVVIFNYNSNYGTKPSRLQALTVNLIVEFIETLTKR